MFSYLIEINEFKPSLVVYVARILSIRKINPVVSSNDLLLIQLSDKNMLKSR